MPREIAIAIPGRVRVCAPNGDVQREIAIPKDELADGYHGSPAGRSILLTHKRSGAQRLSLLRRGRARRLWTTSFVALGHATAVVSADGERVVLPAAGGLALLDSNGSEIAHLALEGGLVDLVFDRAGTRLVASSRSGTVRIWDRDGRRLFDLPDHRDGAHVELSADGRRIATVTLAMARLFTTDVDELEALAARRSTRDFTDVERARYAELLAPAR